MKKVSIGAKPSPGPKSGSADDWVLDRERPQEPMKRLTIDIPKSLHKRVKTGCVLEDVDMVEVVREFLERRFPSQEPVPSRHDEPAPKPDPGNTETQKHDES